MAHRFRFVVPLTLWLMACTSAAESVPVQADPTFPSSVASALQTRIQAWADTSGHQGISAAVVLPDGREWFGTAGIAGSGVPLEPHHLISIASITKSVTGAAILQLSQEGALELDDPVSRWLGELPNVAPEITLRQLLNHSSGVANYTRNPGYGSAVRTDPTRIHEPETIIRTLVGTPSFQPGERTEYTNTAFVLLGMIAETVTGQDIAAIYRERFWEPLGLDEFLLPFAEERHGAVARSWTGRTGDLIEVDPWERASYSSIRWSAFGLVASARNVARWGHALFGSDLLEEETRTQMLQALPAAGNIPAESGVGLGVRRYEFFGAEQWGHSGGSEEGSSLMLFDPESGITVAVLINQPGRTHGASHFFLTPELLGLVRAAQ